MTEEQLTKELAEANKQIERRKELAKLAVEQFELLADIIIDARIEAELVSPERGIGELVELMGNAEEIYETYQQRKAERVAKEAMK